MLVTLIITFGYIGIFITLFAESGFLLGFFLPGDSLLFSAGLLASQGYFNIGLLIVVAIFAAILGDSFGYFIGHKVGRKLFRRPDSLLFKREYVERTEEFYKKHGKKTIILARFVPIVRTFAPVMAGIGAMRYFTFLSYNVIGGVLWGGGFLWLAYWLGGRFPVLQHYLTLAIIVIILLSVLPVVIDILHTRRKNKKGYR